MTPSDDKALQITHDDEMDRYYIPLPGGVEVQTKGIGSSFRIVVGIGTPEEWRLNIIEQPYLFGCLEKVARDVNAATATLRTALQAAEREVKELRERLRWNIEPSKDGLRICKGDHHRSHDCEWEYFFPRERAEAAEGRVENWNEAVETYRNTFPQSTEIDTLVQMVGKLNKEPK